MSILILMAALTLLVMMGTFFYLTREDRALINEENTLPDDLRVRPVPLTKQSKQNGEYSQAA